MNVNDLKRILDQIVPDEDMEKRIKARLMIRTIHKKSTKRTLEVVLVCLVLAVSIVTWKLVVPDLFSSSSNNSTFSLFKFNGELYNVNLIEQVDSVLIDQKIGVVIRYIQGTPKKNGDINVNLFIKGDIVFSIKHIEIENTIAILHDGKYYRLNKIQ